MSKKIKELGFRIRVETLEIAKNDLPSDFQKYYSKPIPKSKIIGVNYIEDISSAIDPKNIPATIDKIRNNKEFQEYFKRANNDNSISHNNFLITYYETFPEHILDIAHKPIETDFFIKVIKLFKEKDKFFNSNNLSLKDIEMFSGSFIEALNYFKIKLHSFNFLDLYFSIIPDNTFNPLLNLMAFDVYPKNQDHIISEILVMIRYKRITKLKELLNTGLLNKVMLRKILEDSSIKAKERSFLLSYLKGIK
jgi:hypothetical protein